MAWHLAGQWLDACSCKLACPCALGPAEPDQGWCSGVFAWLITEGESDGVRLAGAKLALAGDFPGDFLSGMDVARLYFDDATTADQRRDLEAILTGQRGGLWEPVQAIIRGWKPPLTTRIDLQLEGDSPSARVGDIGLLTLQRVKTATGRQARLVDAPMLAGFQIETHDLARSDGSYWADPEMRRWQGGTNGGATTFNWSA